MNVCFGHCFLFSLKCHRSFLKQYNKQTQTFQTSESKGEHDQARKLRIILNQKLLLKVQRYTKGITNLVRLPIHFTSLHRVYGTMLGVYWLGCMHARWFRAQRHHMAHHAGSAKPLHYLAGNFAPAEQETMPHTDLSVLGNLTVSLSHFLAYNSFLTFI